MHQRVGISAHWQDGGRRHDCPLIRDAIEDEHRVPVLQAGGATVATKKNHLMIMHHRRMAPALARG